MEMGTGTSRPCKSQEAISSVCVLSSSSSCLGLGVDFARTYMKLVMTPLVSSDDTITYTSQSMMKKMPEAVFIAPPSS